MSVFVGVCLVSAYSKLIKVRTIQILMPGEPCELEAVALVPHQVPQAGVAQSLGIVATHTLACNGSMRWKTLTVVSLRPVV